MKTLRPEMSELLSDLNRDTLTDAIGVAAICIATITLLWLPGLLAA